MFKDREKLYQVYRAILSMMLTWALTLAMNQYFNLNVHIALCAFFSLALAFMIYIFDINRKNTFSYLIMFSIIPILALIFWIRKTNPVSWLREILEWCSVYNGSEKLYKAAPAHFVVLGVALAGSIISYLLMKKQLTKIVLASLMLVMLIFLSISKIGINKAVVGICIFYILTNLLEICSFFYSRKTGKPEKKAGILYLAPICLLLATLSIGFPSSLEPIEWRGFKNIYNTIADQVDIWMTDLKYFIGNSSGEFSVTFSGYSEDNGGLSNDKLKKNSKVALKAIGYKGNAPYYLMGSISDIYTGSSWEKSRVDSIPDEQEYILDFTEFYYALSRQPMEILENEQLIDRRMLKIQYNNIKTKTFFYPIKSSWFEVLGNTEMPSTALGNITFRHAKGEGTLYQVAFYEMNLQGEAFQNMLRDAEAFSYADDNIINRDTIEGLDINLLSQKNTPSILDKTDFYKVLKARAEMIQNQYTALPDSLPDRVKEMAVLITENYDNSYDKLKALEGFLNEYTYDLNPGKVPKDTDFVDYFLFNNKKGYCTSFATAMAVMGRCIGIPTRYVEGFVVTFNNKDNNTTFLVKNNQAHSWAEAYIEGIGWIPFEATPPFYKNRYATWKERVKPQEGGIIDNYSAELERMKELMKNKGEEELVPIEKKDNKDEIIAGTIILLAATFIVLIFMIIYFIMLRYKYKKDYRISDYSRKMYLDFLRILWLLKREGYVLGSQETILMLSLRVKDEFHYNKVVFPDVAKIFMRYRYGQAAVSKTELEQVEVFYQGLREKQRTELGRMRTLLQEFVFLSKKSNR